MSEPGRGGMSLLASVILLGVCLGVLVTGMHTLWRGSSRTLFSVQEHRELMDRIVLVLLERETIGREEFLALMRGEALPEPPPAAPPAAPDVQEHPQEERRAPQAPSLRPRPEPA